jgi:3-oxoacyl-[acyl-carrier-protein] synthase III
MESELARMQAALGAGAALAVSVGELGCASSTSALMVLDALLRGDPARTTGLITMAAISPTAYRYRRPVTVNGDGGMAVVVTSGRPVFALRDIAQATNGDYWDLFTVDYLKTPQAQWRESCRDERQYTQTLALESLRMAREMTADLLARNGLTWTDVAHLVMQNLSVSSFEFYARSLGRPISPVCAANLAEYGHLGPLDVFLNLRSLERVAGRGDLVLVMNNSPVAAWTVALFEKQT